MPNPLRPSRPNHSRRRTDGQDSTTRPGVMPRLVLGVQNRDHRCILLHGGRVVLCPQHAKMSMMIIGSIDKAEC
jgi:hypothetical protein